MDRFERGIQVYLEVGKKRTLAGAVEWPGWCRAGRDEDSALQALADYGPRYEKIVVPAGLGFQAPVDVTGFGVVERLAGNATTDFGAPDITPSADARPVDAADLRPIEALLRSYWTAFDAAVAAAEGKELRKGPRGGGRDLEGIARHLIEADYAYLARLAWKRARNDARDIGEELRETRQAVLDALGAAVAGALPERGPRGGALWKPRFFVRRLAWHVLDHAWEIEDRV